MRDVFLIVALIKTPHKRLENKVCLIFYADDLNLYNLFCTRFFAKIDSSILGGWGSGSFLEESQDNTSRVHEEGPKGGPLQGLGGHGGGGHMEILYKNLLFWFIHLTAQLYFNPRIGKYSDELYSFLYIIILFTLLSCQAPVKAHPIIVYELWSIYARKHKMSKHKV